MADTLNQVFLMAALKRSQKPADIQHPFGYGMERYFWSLLAAVGIFVLGAGYSIYEGVRAILHPEELTSLVDRLRRPRRLVRLRGRLLVAVPSARSAVRQASRGADTLEHLRATPDPTVKTVAFEDTAALVGIVLAAVGVTLHAVTGQGFWDGAASVAIGLLLIGVAYALGQAEQGLPDRPVRQRGPAAGIQEEIQHAPGVDEVVEVLTMRLAPDEVLVAARVDLDDSRVVATSRMHADEVDRRVRERYPEVSTSSSTRRTHPRPRRPMLTPVHRPMCRRRRADAGQLS